MKPRGAATGVEETSLARVTLVERGAQDRDPGHAVPEAKSTQVRTSLAAKKRYQRQLLPQQRLLAAERALSTLLDTCAPAAEPASSPVVFSQEAPRGWIVPP